MALEPPGSECTCFLSGTLWASYDSSRKVRYPKCHSPFIFYCIRTSPDSLAVSLFHTLDFDAMYESQTEFWIKARMYISCRPEEFHAGGRHEECSG